jgi:hypothetical protein
MTTAEISGTKLNGPAWFANLNPARDETAVVLTYCPAMAPHLHTCCRRTATASTPGYSTVEPTVLGPGLFGLGCVVFVVRSQRLKLPCLSTKRSGLVCAATESNNSHVATPPTAAHPAPFCVAVASGAAAVNGASAAAHPTRWLSVQRPRPHSRLSGRNIL